QAGFTPAVSNAYLEPPPKRGIQRRGSRGGGLPPPRLLAADAKEDHVAVLDPVLPALDPKLADDAQRFHRAGRDELIHRGDLGADEVLLEVGVDLRGGDRRRRVPLAWPGAHLR